MVVNRLTNKTGDFIFLISLFQRGLRFVLDASCQGPTVHLLQEVSGCQTAQ